MVWRTILSSLVALALVPNAAWAQSTPSSPSAKDDEAIQALQQIPQKIREKLTEQGYRDLRVAPGSYVVSAKDKDGNKVMMLISPTETTMMKVPDQYPSQAQTPKSDDDQIIQQ